MWGNNIRMDFKESGWKNVDRIHLAQDMGLVNRVTEHLGSIKGAEFLD
jgi:hypothetical protein